MGGKSSSSSSSSNTQSTENYDQRVAVESNGVGIGAGAIVDVTATDYGVIEGASKVLSDGLNSAAGIVKDVTQSFAGSVKNVTDSFAGIVSENNAILKDQAASDAKQISMLVVKMFGAITAAVLVLWFFMRGK